MTALATALALAAATTPPAAPSDATAETNDAAGYSPMDPDAAEPPLRLTGYVDVGFARAQGDGTSWTSGDRRVPGDYGVDTFATMVNSRGDVASTDAGDRFTNGFLPRSADIGGRASFLVNTVDVDIRYAPVTKPVMIFARLQALPRLTASGASTELVVEQAFARVIPFSSQELALFAGKFDSVFGIEYLQNEANLRTGVTPSLVARYTTGQSVGVKAFYRYELPALVSALSVNVSATNSGTLVEALQGPDASLTGVPIVAARVGYELLLSHVLVKLGGSAARGPRNDQHDSAVQEALYGADARLVAGPVSLAGEYVQVDQDHGAAADKLTGLGPQTLVSGFHARGGYVEAALGFDVPLSWLRHATLYGRYGRRNAWFEGFTPLTVAATSGGVRLDLWESIAAKAEYVHNTELEGEPAVDNDVFTSSLVYTW